VDAAARAFSQREANLTLFQLLISADCDVNIGDKLGWTPLYQATTNGEVGQRTRLSDSKHGWALKFISHF